MDMLRGTEKDRQVCCWLAGAGWFADPVPISCCAQVAMSMGSAWRMATRTCCARFAASMASTSSRWRPAACTRWRSQKMGRCAEAGQLGWWQSATT